MKLTNFLSISEEILCTSLAHEVFTLFLFTLTAGLIKQTSEVDLAALGAVVESGLFKHVFCERFVIERESALHPVHSFLLADLHSFSDN